MQGIFFPFNNVFKRDQQHLHVFNKQPIFYPRPENSVSFSKKLPQKIV